MINSAECRLRTDSQANEKCSLTNADEISSSVSINGISLTSTSNPNGTPTSTAITIDDKNEVDISSSSSLPEIFAEKKT